VLIAVVPESRRVEIRTSADAAQRVDDDRCQAAVDRMLTVFATGDLAGGIIAGVEELAG
jgi:uncharacterized membrane protein YgcG